MQCGLEVLCDGLCVTSPFRSPSLVALTTLTQALWPVSFQASALGVATVFGSTQGTHVENKVTIPGAKSCFF